MNDYELLQAIYRYLAGNAWDGCTNADNYLLKSKQLLTTELRRAGQLDIPMGSDWFERLIKMGCVEAYVMDHGWRGDEEHVTSTFYKLVRRPSQEAYDVSLAADKQRERDEAVHRQQVVADREADRLAHLKAGG